MTSTLMTTWSEHDAALDRILGLAEREICIFDRDLAALKLDKPDRIEQLRRVLFASPKHQLRIVVQDGSRIALANPRLMRLLTDASHGFVLTLASDNVAGLTDSMVICDGRHALIRFHRDHARSKSIEDDADGAMPYRRRFDDILGEGGTPFSARPAGL